MEKYKKVVQRQYILSISSKVKWKIWITWWIIFCIRYLTLKRLEEGSIWPPPHTPPPRPLLLCSFSKNLSSKEKVKSSFFVTFNIITSHIFPEDFIKIPQVVQKIWRISLFNIIYFHLFSSIFWIFWHYLVTKK